jgi:hypothetical protein
VHEGLCRWAMCCTSDVPAPRDFLHTNAERTCTLASGAPIFMTGAPELTLMGPTLQRIGTLGGALRPHK